MMNTVFSITFTIALISSAFLPLDIPYGFDSTAKVYPLRQWDLLKGNDGSLVGSLHNYESGAIEDYTSYQFDRGDIIHINFGDRTQLDGYAQSGEEMANISSAILSEKLIQLDNELNVEMANLAIGRSGQKSAIISQSTEVLHLAEQELDLRTKNVERAKNLYPEGLIALADLESAQNLHIQAMTKVEMAKRAITVKRTGEKPQQIDFIYAKIDALQKEIAFLKEKEANYSIQSPISGKVVYESTVDHDRLIVEDVTSYILYIPIKLKDRDFLDLNATVNVKFMGSDSLITAQIFEIGDKVQVLDRNFIVTAKARLAGIFEGISTGMPVKCSVSCGSVTPLEYITRSVRSSI